MWQDHSPAEMAGLSRLGFTGIKLMGTGGRVNFIWLWTGHRGCRGMWRILRPTSFHHTTATRQESP